MSKKNTPTDIAAYDSQNYNKTSTGQTTRSKKSRKEVESGHQNMFEQESSEDGRVQNPKGVWTSFEIKQKSPGLYSKKSQTNKNSPTKNSSDTDINLLERPEVALVSTLFQMLDEKHSMGVRRIRTLQKKFQESYAKGEIKFDHPVHRSDVDEEPTLAFLTYEKFNTWLASINRPERVVPPKAMERAKHGDNEEAQKRAILNALREHGEDPMNLPKIKAPTPTIKKTIRDSFVNDRSNKLFTSAGVFNERWKDLLKEKQIKYRPHE